MIYSLHAKPVSTIDERGSSQGFLDEITKEMGLIWKVETFHTAFGNNTAVIGLKFINIDACKFNK